MSAPPSPQPSSGVFLVNRLTADAELVRDPLPRPASGPRVPDLERLEVLEELAKSGDGSKTDHWVGVSRRRGELGRLPHCVNLR